jgi:hypothetical protein
VKETGVPGKNHRPVASHWQTLSHTVVLIAQIVGFTYEHNHPTWFDYWITNIIINTHSFAVSSATCTIIKELKYYCYYWYSSLQYEMQVWSGQYSPIGFIFIIEDSICGFLIVQADWCHKGKTNKSSTYMSELSLFQAKWAIFQSYHGENKLQSMRWWCPLYTTPIRLLVVGLFWC